MYIIKRVIRNYTKRFFRAYKRRSADMFYHYDIEDKRDGFTSSISYADKFASFEDALKVFNGLYSISNLCIINLNTGEELVESLNQTYVNSSNEIQPNFSILNVSYKDVYRVALWRTCYKYNIRTN